MIISFSISLIYSINLPNIYKSEALLSPSKKEESLNSSLSRFQGLANLTGVNIPFENSSDTREHVKRLSSFSFFELILENHEILPDLLAAKSWDKQNNAVIYDESVYLNDENIWILDGRRSSVPPTSQKAYEIFKKKFKAYIDRDTNLIVVSFEHISPSFAKNLINTSVELFNEMIGEEEKIKAQRSVDFLNDQMLKTDLSEIKTALGNLLEIQIQTLMLVESTENHAFKIIDGAIAPEIKTSPSRLTIVILGSLAGIFLTLIVIILFSLRETFLKELKEN
tara:strand:- start:3835 stop:4677 length:843 start_codon:yes stop_codon:yes gene_type:complete